jgi:hypothetical protein
VQLEAPRKGAERQAGVQKEAVRAAVGERAGVVQHSLERVMNALIVDIDDARRGELEALPACGRCTGTAGCISIWIGRWVW